VAGSSVRDIRSRSKLCSLIFTPYIIIAWRCLVFFEEEPLRCLYGTIIQSGILLSLFLLTYKQEIPRLFMRPPKMGAGASRWVSHPYGPPAVKFASGIIFKGFPSPTASVGKYSKIGLFCQLTLSAFVYNSQRIANSH
jgi:hypothetical protein